MPKGISNIRYLYEILRGADADCLDLSSVIDLLKDMDKRLESLSNRLDRSDSQESKRQSPRA